MNLEDEVICGHLVTAQKKRVNAMYLEMLREFDRICQGNDLTWWLAFGSLLGAVRHRGFIPWDDDVDILMPRKDFDRLLKLSNEQLGVEPPYFMQTPHTDPAFQQRILRFRRSDTSYITRYDMDMARKAGRPYDMGLALAIFPLDNVPKSRLLFSLQKKIAKSGVSYRTEEGGGKRGGGLKRLVFGLAEKLLSEKTIVSMIHGMYRICPVNRTGLVQSFEGFYTESCIWPAEDFAGTVRLPFEDITVPAPSGWDHFLKITYGDYMQFPPPEARVEKHSDFMSADVPWPEALKMVEDGRITLR